MSKEKYQVYGIASGICAEQYGAELGVWDIFYSLNKEISNLKMKKVFYHDSIKSKLDTIEDIKSFFQEVNLEVIKNHSKEDKFLFYTGDHANAIGVWSSISNTLNQDIGIIWVDAHLDSHTPETSDSKNVHGMPVAHLMGFGDNQLSSLINKKIQPENFCFIATRDYENKEIEFIQKHNIKTFFMKDISRDNINNIFKEAIKVVTKNNTKFGISIDMDSMSPEFTPGTGCYNPNGLHLDDVIHNISLASNHEQFIGLELTEFNPLLDKKRKTFKAIIEITKAIL